MSEELVAERLHDGAALRLTFARPKGNVLTTALLERLDAALAEHTDAPHLKLVMIEGAGANFSFGASVEEHQRELVGRMLATFHALVRRLMTYPVPTAALVRGKCLGGAFELALACNFVIASRDATFACPEISLGVFPPVLAALGPLRLGASWSQRLALTGEDLGADAARALGFVTETAPDGVDVRDHASTWFAKTFAKRSAFSVRQALAATRHGAAGALSELAAIERQYLERIVPSFDGNEGIAAFLAKRPPAWRNA